MSIFRAAAREIQGIEKNSKPRRRKICADFDFDDFSGLQ
jgi:hypothetical protein